MFFVCANEQFLRPCVDADSTRNTLKKDEGASWAAMEREREREGWRGASPEERGRARDGLPVTTPAGQRLPGGRAPETHQPRPSSPEAPARGGGLTSAPAKHRLLKYFEKIPAWLSEHIQKNNRNKNKRQRSLYPGNTKSPEPRHGINDLPCACRKVSNCTSYELRDNRLQTKDRYTIPRRKVK